MNTWLRILRFFDLQPINRTIWVARMDGDAINSERTVGLGLSRDEALERLRLCLEKWYPSQWKQVNDEQFVFTGELGKRFEKRYGYFNRAAAFVFALDLDDGDAINRLHY